MITVTYRLPGEDKNRIVECESLTYFSTLNDFTLLKSMSDKPTIIKPLYLNAIISPNLIDLAKE